MSTFTLRRIIAPAVAVAIPLSIVLASGSGAASGARPALYSASQASSGAKLYDTNCSTCHGEQLEGGAGPALSGPNLRTLGQKTHLSIGDMYDYVISNMPMNAPGSLKAAQYSAIMAYILKFNGYPAGSTALTPAKAAASTQLVTSYK